MVEVAPDTPKPGAVLEPGRALPNTTPRGESSRGEGLSLRSSLVEKGGLDR